MIDELPTIGELAEMSNEEIEQLWDNKLKAERLAIVKAQLATMPQPNEDGEIDLSMQGSWARCGGVVDSKGRRVHEYMKPLFMLGEE